MRIAMLTNNYKPFIGGVPISIDRLSGALRERGHDVTIFAPRYPDGVEEDGVVRYRTRKKQLRDGIVVPAITAPEVEQRFREERFDLIHVHHPMMIGYTGMYLSKKYDIPLALTYHTRYEQYLHHLRVCAKIQAYAESVDDASAGRLMQKIVTAHNRVFTNACDLVFAPTPLMRDWLWKNGTTSPVEILPTGLSEEDFSCDDTNAKRIREAWLDGKKYLFCSVSRLEQEKNIPFLLRSLSRFKEQHGDCFRMLMIGEGSGREALCREAEQLGLRQNIFFTGALDHNRLSDYYRACDLFLFASKSETQGIVLLEAMAAGLPVLAVDASGVCDVVEDGINGWRTSEDEADFAAHMIRTLSDAPLLARLRAGAGCTAGRFRAANMAQNAETCYEKMLREKGVPGYANEPARYPLPVRR